MKVILTQDVKSLGKKNEIVNVSDGYANNFLLKKKLAVPATSGGIKDVENKKQAQEDKIKRETEIAKAKAQEISNKTVLIKLKCGEGGRLFGAVSSKEIAEELNRQFGYKIDKKDLVAPGIKSLGTYTVKAKLYSGVVAEFKVRVEGE